MFGLNDWLTEARTYISNDSFSHSGWRWLCVLDYNGNDKLRSAVAGLGAGDDKACKSFYYIEAMRDQEDAWMGSGNTASEACAIAGMFAKEHWHARGGNCTYSPKKIIKIKAQRAQTCSFGMTEAVLNMQSAESLAEKMTEFHKSIAINDELIAIDAQTEIEKTPKLDALLASIDKPSKASIKQFTS